MQVAVALVDPRLCTSLSKAQTAAMALAALSACVDALLARELALGAGTPTPNGDVLLELGSRGIGAVAEGLPVALADGGNMLARELLTMGSVCAGQLAAVTPAPPIQVQCCSRRRDQVRHRPFGVASSGQRVQTKRV